MVDEEASFKEEATIFSALSSNVEANDLIGIVGFLKDQRSPTGSFTCGVQIFEEAGLILSFGFFNILKESVCQFGGRIKLNSFG